MFLFSAIICIFITVPAQAIINGIPIKTTDARHIFSSTLGVEILGMSGSKYASAAYIGNGRILLARHTVEGIERSVMTIRDIRGNKKADFISTDAKFFLPDDGAQLDKSQQSGELMQTDLAVLELPQEVKEQFLDIPPAKLSLSPISAEQFKKAELFYAVGWGDRSLKGDAGWAENQFSMGRMALKQAYANVLLAEWNPKVDEENRRGLSMIRSGDSGGPLYFMNTETNEFEIVGVISRSGITQRGENILAQSFFSRIDSPHAVKLLKSVGFDINPIFGSLKE